MRFEDYLISCGYRFVVTSDGTKTGWYRNGKRATYSTLLALSQELQDIQFQFAKTKTKTKTKTKKEEETKQ